MTEPHNHRASGDPRPANREPYACIWALDVGLLVVAGVVWWLHLRHLLAPPLTIEALHLPWWALALGFATTELCVVHIHFRRSAHSLSLSDLPLVMGLLFSTPTEVMIAWVGGAAIALAFQRGQSPVKLAFNLTLFAVVSGLAESVSMPLAARRSD